MASYRIFADRLNNGTAHLFSQDNIFRFEEINQVFVITAIFRKKWPPQLELEPLNLGVFEVILNVLRGIFSGAFVCRDPYDVMRPGYLDFSISCLSNLIQRCRSS